MKALELALPTRSETQLLQVCLHDGERARRAWERWRSEVGDAESALPGARPELRRLVPLVHRGLRAAGEDVAPAGLLRRLNVASVHEELRAATLRGLIHEVLRPLAQMRTPPLVLKGVPLAELAYPDPAFRHCHDVDLLLAPTDVPEAIRRLVDGDGPLSPVAERRDGTTTLAHPSGVTVNLHTRAFPPPLRDATADMAARARPSMIAGAMTQVLAPPDALVHVCGTALCGQRRPSLTWVADAWFTVRRWPALSWPALEDSASAAGVELPVSVALRYLARELGLPVPPEVLGRLERRAQRVRGACRDTALAAAWSARERMQSPWTPTGRRQRRALVRWALFPSPAYLRACRGQAPLSALAPRGLRFAKRLARA